MRKVLGRLHLYLGLFCASYLIIFGLTSLNFNHHFAFFEPNNDKVTWEKSLAVPDNADDRKLAESVRDTLGLMGWTPYWRFHRDEQNNFTFEIARPAKNYVVKLNPERTLAQVEETRMGFMSAYNSLHALGGLPNSNLVKVWPIYTEVCVFFVLFAVATGIYFWAKRRDEKLIGGILLLGGSGGSILFMLFIWLRG